MAEVTAAIPTVEDLQKLSAEIGRVTGEVELTLWRLEKMGEEEGPNRLRLGAAELGHITYFVEGLRLDAANLKEWGARFENEAQALFEGWPSEASPV